MRLYSLNKQSYMPPISTPEGVGISTRTIRDFFDHLLETVFVKIDRVMPPHHLTNYFRIVSKLFGIIAKLFGTIIQLTYWDRIRACWNASHPPYTRLSVCTMKCSVLYVLQSASKFASEKSCETEPRLYAIPKISNKSSTNFNTVPKLYGE